MIVIGIDSHKRTHTAVAVDGTTGRIHNTVIYGNDAPDGSDELTARFVAALEDAGLGWARIDVDRRSDHGPFAAAGIPIGGLFSGGRELVTEEQAAGSGAVAGQPSDPCSDARCDTIDNVDLATHVELSRIAARVLVTVATDETP